MIEEEQKEIEEKVQEAGEKEREEKKKFVKFCPHCRSKNIKTDFGPARASGMLGKFSAIGAPFDYVCNDCDFRARIFPEIEEKQDEAEKIKIEPEFKRICPNCKSFNVKTEFPISPAHNIPDYTCLDCNFRGKIFPEINLHEKKEKKEEKTGENKEEGKNKEEK